MTLTEIEVDKLLGRWCDLEGKIKSSVISKFDYNKKSDEELYKSQDQLLYSSKDIVYTDMLLKSDYCNKTFETELAEDTTGESNIVYSGDLSNLADSQKHIALCGSDTEIMEITTTDDKRYFAKLKAMEVDEHGKLIMTFLPSSQREFIKNKDIFSLNAGNTTSYLNVKQDQLTCYQYNTIESCRNNIEFTQGKTQGFKSLDEAASSIFNKLLPIINNDLDK